MSASIVSPHQPTLIMPGMRAIARGTERYVVKGSGSMTFAIEAGDRIILSLFEGGQTAEIAAFTRDGRDGLANLGLQGRGEAEALKRILSEETEDAARVRFGLSRRGLDLGKVRSATIFSPDARAGEQLNLTASEDLFFIIAAPGEAMTVWDQNPPTDILVFIHRATILPPGKARLPEPLAEPRLDITVPIASARSFEVEEGEYIQIVDVAGRQCSDFLAFHRKALDGGKVLTIDSTTTRTMTGLSYPRPGLLSKFFDNDRNALVEVVQDTVGRHDTFGLACTSRYYDDMGYFGHANCSDNLSEEMAPFGIDAQKGWPAINYFFNTNVNHLNQIWFDEPWSRPGDYVLMRALTDLVCAATSCPDDIDAANGWELSEIQVRVYPKTALFRRAYGYRMSPDSPLQLTQETGFHARTSALTRSFAEYKGFFVPTCFSKNGPVDEYWACRERAVVMDLSPLRKIEVMGPDAESLMQRVMTRDVSKLGIGQIVYSAICHEHGGMIDDGTLFRLGAENFRWIGGSDDSLLHIKEEAARQNFNVILKSATSQIHNIAVQGPRSRDILRKMIWTPPGRPGIDELGWFKFTTGRIHEYQGIPILLSRTGYTGELGFEIFCHPKDAPKVWDAVMEAGAEDEIAPFGFDALDMVRIEAGLIVAGNEFDSSTDPFEAGIGFAAPSRKEEDFIGREALLERRAHPQRQLVGLEITGNEAVGHGDPVMMGRAKIGVVTSGMKSPLLGKTIALARVEVRHAGLGGALEIGKLDSHQKRLATKVVHFPFYDPEKTRVRA
jgi:aminomethyltransferase